MDSALGDTGVMGVGHTDGQRGAGGTGYRHGDAGCSSRDDFLRYSYGAAMVLTLRGFYGIG